MVVLGGKAQAWAKQKKNPVIAAGLNPFCSLVPSSTWEKVRKHTNAVEQSHQKSYALGRQQALVPGILK
jgi:hypothetical protein